MATSVRKMVMWVCCDSFGALSKYIDYQIIIYSSKMMKYRIGWENNKRPPSETKKNHNVHMKIRQMETKKNTSQHTHIHMQSAHIYRFLLCAWTSSTK